MWTNAEVPPAYITSLWRHGATIHAMELGWKQRMFYRLLIHDLPGVDRYLVRDADSRISMRERRCVDEWIRSGKVLHSIHDHFYHQRPIQGGMFGIWRSQFVGARSMREMIGDWPNDDRWGRDEEFLEACLWPMVKHSVCEHGRANPMPPGEDEDPQAFVGEIYDAQGRPEHPEHRLMGKK